MTKNMIDISNLSTEQKNDRTENLDTLDSHSIVKLMNEEDMNVIFAVKNETNNIAKAIDAISKKLKLGGRLIYVGAGSSGRIGVIDSAECPPTFGVKEDMVIGLIAGGNDAMFSAIEGAEDSFDYGRKDLINLNLSAMDTVVGLAASGRTPYVIGALKYARSIGALSISISCSKNSEISKLTDIGIEVNVGPEILTGSTRLKAGTAQKMILNMISTGVMVKLGKVYKNLMVDVKATNNKLKSRAINIFCAVTKSSSDEAKLYISKAKGSVKVAIIMKLLGYDYKKALDNLEYNEGFLRKCIGENEDE